MNQDGSVNWLPVCADAHGFVVNKDLLKVSYSSANRLQSLFCLSGIQKSGDPWIHADYFYDYTCMETLQGLSASELSTAAGRKWRTVYSDPDNTKREGLDS